MNESDDGRHGGDTVVDPREGMPELLIQQGISVLAPK